ncbi:carbonic anhydrase, partial [Gymnopilus junonius]
NAVLAFAISSLKVRHIVVLGHYGCGGIANSMMMPNPGSDSMMPNQGSVQDSILPTPTAEAAVQRWIQPVRELYEMSLRPEIIAHREKAKMEPLIELPGIREPAFRALIEENLKLNVKKVANSRVIQEVQQEPEQDVFIHGWIYDMESGRVFDLGVSVGPPGREVPRSPFPLVGSSQV